jgi:hypothetical protein
MRNAWMVLATCALLAGCEDEADKGAAPEKAPVATPPPAEAAPPKAFDAATLQADAQAVALVPSPAEMERAMANAGIQAKLGDTIKDRKITMDVDNKDQIAVRTGVVLADLVLTVKDSSKETLVARLALLKTGFQKLGAGSDIQATIDELSAQISNDAISRDKLLQEMDELSGVMVPELEYEAGEWVVPLIHAGSWLEGAHLVSGALKAEKKYGAADGMLRQPAVVDYFIKYVNREGSEKAPDEVVARLRETLNTLKVVASKPSLGEEDVETIHSSTGAVLSML